MKSAVTSGIEIKVSTRFEANFSNEEKNEFLFSYAIEIKNTNDFSVRLLNRHWHITDGIGRVRQVDGVGVIGKQPKISPNAYFSYESACDFPTHIGKMHGYYLFENLENGFNFKVYVPEFTMISPQKLN
jgi:ApaG protein